MTDHPGRAPWVLVSAGFHEFGGQSKANAALADYLLGRGHALHLVGHDIDERYRGRPGVYAHVVACPGGRDLLGWRPLEREGRRVAAEVTAAHPGARVVVNGGCCEWPDLNWVHCVHHAWGLADAGAPIWFRLKNRLIKRWARGRERRAVRAARLVVANSDLTRRQVVEHLGVAAQRVHVAHLGADPSWTLATPGERAEGRRRLGLPSDVPVVAFVGALSHDHNKGFDTLLAAWRALAAEAGWDARLVVAGDGNGLDAWKSRVERDGLAPTVRFLGFSKQLMDLLPAADLLVSPARYEAYGLNVQEAVCRGVPALVSSRAGVVERYPPELAEMILPDPDDWRDLAARLRRWGADPEGWRARFAGFSDSLRRRGWADMAADIVRIAESAPPP